MVLDYSGDWTKLLSSNSAATSFADTDPSTTSPDGTSGVIDMLDNATGGTYPYLQFIAFGTDTAGDVFQVRFSGVAGFTGGTTQYATATLTQFTCTLASGIVGAATLPILNTDLLVDTMTVDSGFGDGVFANAISPADDIGVALGFVDCRGFRYVKVTFDMGAGGNSGNIAYRRLHSRG